VVAMGRDSSKQSWNKCSDRSQHEYKDQPSFELFQFKSIRFFSRPRNLLAVENIL
jgi:hypothetical protein